MKNLKFMHRCQVLLTCFLFIAINANAGVKAKYMWFDCEANYACLSHPDSIAFYLDKLKTLGFSDVIVDVKSIMGETLYKSNYAPYMKEWKGVTRPDDYDMMGIFIREGHKRNMKVHASLNVFCGGNNLINRGIIFGEHADWQAQVYWAGKLVPISEIKLNYNGMLNPANKDVRNYEMNILKEVTSRYKDMDGIILDRVRYDGISSDFSAISKEAFEKYAKLNVEKFPQDILYWEKDAKGSDVWKPGKYFNLWVEWRASLIYHFFADAKKELKAINPKLLFGDYTGAWYPVYYEVGVNWASNKYDPSKEYNWATPKYKNFGYAELLDIYISGLYYTEVTIADLAKANGETDKKRTEAAMGKGRDYWYSIEGGARLAKEITKGVVPVAGSIYVDQYKDPEQFKRAISMCLSASDGLMVFDIVHIIHNHWWDYLESGIKDAENKK